ncbi:MAG: hypothetical protein KY467_14885, partial [Gemmatimonadetes bacterium]|nr:hypothetical protein [Gemmatimonadota bacterium]
VAQLADIAGGLQALGAAASAPAPGPPPAPEPVRPADDLPQAIRAAVAPLIEAIRASHAQQSQAADAMLRVISAVRVEPAPAGPAAEPARAAVAAERVAGESAATTAAGEADAATAEPAAAATEKAAAATRVSLPPAPPEEEPRVEETLQNLPIVGGETKPVRVWPPSR